MKKSEKEVIAGGKVRTRKREFAELHNGRDVTMGTLETMGTLGTKEVGE